MVLTDEEKEINEFYEAGMSIAEISEATEYTKYQLKKLLGDKVPSPWPIGYIFRHLKDW